MCHARAALASFENTKSIFTLIGGQIGSLFLDRIYYNNNASAIFFLRERGEGKESKLLEQAVGRMAMIDDYG